MFMYLGVKFFCLHVLLYYIYTVFLCCFCIYGFLLPGGHRLVINTSQNNNNILELKRTFCYCDHALIARLSFHIFPVIASLSTLYCKHKNPDVTQSHTFITNRTLAPLIGNLVRTKRWLHLSNFCQLMITLHVCCQWNTNKAIAVFTEQTQVVALRTYQSLPHRWKTNNHGYQCVTQWQTMTNQGL
jgi:hypothetical protein